MRRVVLLALAICLLLPAFALARKAKAPSKTTAATSSVQKQAPKLTCPASAIIGEPFLARVESPGPLKGARIEFLGRSAPLDLRQNAKAGKVWAGYLVLGADVLDGRPGQRTVSLRHSGGSVRAQVELAAIKRPVESLTLDPSMVNPPAEELPRIARERALVRQALATTSPLRLSGLPLLRPGKGEMSSEYGIGRILNGVPKSPHRGMDMEAVIGDEIVAAADGVVLLSGELYYAGRCVYLDHGQGLVTMYFHLSERKVEQGQRVARGQLIGLAGETGRSTRPHLHFGVSALGRLVDPGPLFGYDVLP